MEAYLVDVWVRYKLITIMQKGGRISIETFLLFAQEWIHRCQRGLQELGLRTQGT